LDGPNLALRLSHRRARVLDALQVVPARVVRRANLACKQRTSPVPVGDRPFLMRRGQERLSHVQILHLTIS
jgi:hypothetical protein